MTTVRLLTWNVWGKSGDWRRRENALLAAIAEADIIAIQEARAKPTGRNHTAGLAAALGFAHHHQAGPPPLIRDRGLGVLIRWPITGHTVIALTAGGEPDEHRIGWLWTSPRQAETAVALLDQDPGRVRAEQEPVYLHNLQAPWHWRLMPEVADIHIGGHQPHHNGDRHSR
jgi:Endonuclease/Exonuclease/phosphatase family